MPSYCSHRWSQSVTISQAIHRALMLSEGSLSQKKVLNEKNTRTDLLAVLAVIIGVFVVGTDGLKTVRTYDHVWEALKRAKLRPEPSRNKPPHKSRKVAILRLKFDRKRTLIQTVRNQQTYSETLPRCLKIAFQNLRKIQELLGYWNWFWLLVREDMSIFQNC